MRASSWLGCLYAASSLCAALILGACREPPGGADGCVSCHTGIEQAHRPIPEDQCTVCHGGDPEATTKSAAHIPIPADWAEIRGNGLPPAPQGFIEDFAPDQLDALDPAYLRFINPGDLRVVWSTCGRCHEGQARTLPNNIMVTNAGHYYPTQFLAGLQDDRLARIGSYPATDPDCDESVAGTVCEVNTLVPPSDDEIRAAIQSNDLSAIEAIAYEHYLAKNCNTCHQAGYPRNDSPGLYRSTGCTSCHMLYDKLGTYEGNDPTIARGSPVHPSRHEITRAIPTSQCVTCHFQGGRIGLLYQGIREGGFGNAPEHAEAIPETLFGHAPGYYFTDEDTTNSVDESPPDVHFERGMHCADCHVGAEVHGDGRLYASSKQQVDLRCEDCHGTIRAAASPNARGVFETQNGRPLPQLHQEADGSVVLTGAVDAVEHRVPQVIHSIDAGQGAHQVMPNRDDWSHTDSLTCDSCHTSYNLYCIGCHVSFDLRLSQVDYQTGRVSSGLTRGSRSFFSLDSLLLGTAPDGRIQTVSPSQQVDMAVIGAESLGSGDGEVLLGARVERNGDSEVLGQFRQRTGFEANNGFVPFFQHTSSRSSRPCEACHRRDDSAEELARVRGVYGFGTGEYMLEAPDGTFVDGLRFLDDAGNPVTAWVHEGTGPVEREARDRALAVVLTEL